MLKWLLASGCLAIGGVASAQIPFPAYGGYGGYGNNGYGYGSQYGPYANYGMGYGMPFMPNMYNRTTQPLSPYLNLLRGGNTGVNYFYGVRPGLMPGAMGFGGGFGTPMMGTMASRSGYIPGAANPTSDPVELPEAGQPIESLPPSGHPVTFGMGASPWNRMSPFNRGMMGNRPGTTGQPGTGNSRPMTQPRR